MEFIQTTNLADTDIWPISIFYVESKDSLIRNSKLTYANSKYYQTPKMRCMYSYKPSFLI